MGATELPAVMESQLSDRSISVHPKSRKLFSLECGCCKHKKSLQLPQWFTKPLLLIYAYTGGIWAHILFFMTIYTTVLSVSPFSALPPRCRRIAIPADYSEQKNGTSAIYEIALECRGGDGLSVIIFYAFGFLFGEIMEAIRLPGLLGMLLGGLLLRNVGGFLTSEEIFHTGHLPNGSYPVFPNFTNTNQIPVMFASSPFVFMDTRAQISATLRVNPSLSGILRQLALTTILTRAGLGLDPCVLKEVAGNVFRLTFIPCVSEALVLMLVSHFLIGWPWVWGAILGFVCSAVSPAVVVPNMIRLESRGLGVAKGIPTLVVAASSLDDVVAISGFGVALSIALSTGSSIVKTLFQGPGEALIGALFGIAVGGILCLFPPPKVQHSHIVRGILLICLAVTGLLGSVKLYIPGAGALACLTSALVAASGWRYGLPWCLTQPSSDKSKTPKHHTMTSNELERPNLNYELQKQDLAGRNEQSIFDDVTEGMYGRDSISGYNSIRSRSSLSRRFSLPEPTAHYEQELFAVPNSFARMSSSSSTRQVRKSQKHRQISSNLSQRSGMASGQPVERVVEEDEYKDESTETHPEQEVEVRDLNNIQNVESQASATPTERGLVCLNSMRSDLAAVWWFVQPILFSLIGSEVNILDLKGESTGRGVGSFLIALCARMGATFLAVLPSKLNLREKIFIVFAWLPKATIQAAVGPVALDTARHLNAPVEIIGYGEQVLTIAVISIIITAPLGALLIPLTAPYLLEKEQINYIVSHEQKSTKAESDEDDHSVHVTISTDK